MKSQLPVKALLFGVALLFSCAQGSEKQSDTPDSLASNTTGDTSTYAGDEDDYNGGGDFEPASPLPRDVIGYTWVWVDSVREPLRFSPLNEIYWLSNAAVRTKDSLEYARNTTDLTDSKDSMIFMPKMRKAHQAILAYQSAMKAGIKVGNRTPIERPGKLNEDDKSVAFLPNPGDSRLLKQENFFFLGGAPFVERINEVFRDAEGLPELRFFIDVPENADYLFKHIYRGGPVNVSFGPPLGSYDSGPVDVFGIGSLKHAFIERPPVWLITYKGAVVAHLVSIQVDIADAYEGCTSSLPVCIFAVPENMDPHDILGVYIPTNQESLAACKVTQQSPAIWLADLNGDGIDDIASVSDVSSGASTDELVATIWFANINGTWKIIDAAVTPDCT